MTARKRVSILSAEIIVIVFAFASPIFAHTGHKKPHPPQTVETKPYTVQTRLTSQPPSESLAQELESGKRELQTIMREAAMSHFHNKLIHFPLALGVTASILIFFASRRAEMIPAIRILLIVGAVFAVAAYFTGRAQEEPFEYGEMAEILTWHERLGTTSGILLWIGVFVTSYKQARGWLPIYAVIQLAALAGTGFLGGVLAHG